MPCKSLHRKKANTDLECFSGDNGQNDSLLRQSVPRASLSRGLLAELKDSWVSRAPFWLLEVIRSQSSDGLPKAALPSTLWSINTPLVFRGSGRTIASNTSRSGCSADPNSRVYHYVHVACHFGHLCNLVTPMGCENWKSASLSYHLSSRLIVDVINWYYLLSLKSPFLFYFYLLEAWRREMAQQSRALAIPPEDSSLVPITHIGWLTVPGNCRTSGSDSSGLCGHLHMRVTHTK